jgi:nuclear transport factor 2 (NTF2) superfamily protein
VSLPSPTVVAAQIGHPQSESSKTKISIANKGKQPWNKGVQHSDETRAKIAATSARNARVKIEAKAAAMGMSLAEWDANLEEKRLERKNKPRPLSEETRAKISVALKARWNNPEFKEKMSNKVRANFGNNTGRTRSHTPETRKRISEALKNKWANDPEYRQRVVTTGISAETRGKISASLRERWREPTFRALMADRNRGEMSDEHRLKISDAIKVGSCLGCVWGGEKTYFSRVCGPPVSYS